RRENPLLRRVRRHANTTTLFRMEGGENMSPAAPPPVVVQAFPAPTSPAPPALASEQSVAAAVARAEMPDPNVQRQQAPAPAPPQPAQPAPQPAVQDDPNDTIPWRRLSRIAELHRQRAQREADSEQQSAVSGQPLADSGQPSAVSGQQSAASGPVGTPQQQVPLEAAWPVQREPQAQSKPPVQGGQPPVVEQPVQRAAED